MDLARKERLTNESCVLWTLDGDGRILLLDESCRDCVHPKHEGGH